MNTKNYQYLIFDLDGTLSDPQTGIYNGFRHALTNMNREQIDPSIFHELIGPPLQDSMRKYFFDNEEDVWKAIGYFRAYYSTTGLFENELYAGIETLLFELSRLNKQLFVATNKPQPFAEKILTHFNIASLFQSIHGVDLNKAIVSKEELIEKIIHTIGATNLQNMVMIGDTKYDIIAAKQFGMDTIGLTYGFGTLDSIVEAAPTFVLHSVEELHHFLLGN
jgi:phosphoglycolate phosphatase